MSTRRSHRLPSRKRKPALTFGPEISVAVFATKSSGCVRWIYLDGWLADGSIGLNVLPPSLLSLPSLRRLKNGTGPGIVIPEFKSVSGCDARPFGWYFNHMAMENKAQKAFAYIRLPNMSSTEGFSVVLSSGARSDHVGLEACDTIKHHQIQPQKVTSLHCRNQRQIIYDRTASLLR